MVCLGGLQCSVKEDDYEDDVTLVWNHGDELSTLAQGPLSLLRQA